MNQTSRSRWAVALGGVLCVLPDLPALGWRAVPTWAALVTGVAVALVLGNPWAARTKALTPRLLAASVVGLGAAMDLQVVARVGLQGLEYTAIGIVGTMLLGIALGRMLAVRRNAALLVSVGTAICGGSAIAAAAPAIGADDDDTSVSLAIVFLLNAVALLVFPPVGHALGMSQRAFGLWAALAIHDTSSVVGAAATYGPEALVIATTTKLARALWIVPLTFALGFAVARREGEGARKGKAKRPWFILGFLAAAALVTWLPALRPAGHVVAEVARRTLVLTLFLLGLGLSRDAVARMGMRPFALGVALWIVAGVATLGSIQAGLIR